MALPATICHTFHPNHQLSLVTTAGWFTGGFRCDACNQPGKSSEQFYGCEPCNFTVHAHCATAPAVLEHPLFVGSRFILIENETTQNGSMTCQACGGETAGFRYFNKEPSLYLHPCCAILPTRVVQDNSVFQLLKNASVKCGICKDKSESSFSYGTSYKDGEHLYLHVPCLVRIHNLVTGYKNWQPSAPIVEGVSSAVSTGVFEKHSASVTTTATSSAVSTGASKRLSASDTTTATPSAISTAAASSSSSSKRDNILKYLKVSYKVVSVVAHVATLDFESAAEAIQDLKETR